MSRVFFGVEKGLDVFAENGDLQVRILSGTAAPVGTGDQASAPIGSLYVRSGTGELYQKILNNGNAGDWELNGAGNASIGTWRPESLVLVTNEIQGAGTRDMVASPFSDDNGVAVAIGEFVVGKHIISDADGTPVLLEITAVVGNDVTYALASNPLVEDDTFITRNYLPDVDGQENSAIVNYNGSVIIKIADIDFAIATGINLSGGYTSGAGVVASGDSVEEAIEKLDGNIQNLENSKIVGVEITGLTTLATVDQVPVASVLACKWLVVAFEEATPANVKASEVYAVNNGTLVDDTNFAKLKVGSNFDLSLSVDISGGNMRLRAASTTAGVTVRARRIEVIEA